MITVKFKGANPEEIRQQAMTVFGLVEPTASTDLMLGDQFHTSDGGEAVVVQTGVPPAAPKPTRGRKAKPAEPATELKGDPDTAPEVIDMRPKAEKAADDVGAMPSFLDRTTSAAEATLEEVRAALTELIGTKGVSDKAVFELLGQFKTEAGEPCKKASLLLAKDRGSAIAVIKEYIAKVKA